MTPKEFILEHFRRHKGELVFIMIIAFIGAVLGASIPFIQGRLFDLAIIPASPMNIILSIIAIWFVLGVVSYYITNKVGVLGLILGSKISLEAEAEAYGHFVSLPIPFHKRNKKGEILQRISRGSWNLQDTIENVAEILPQFIMLVISLGVMFWIQWQLALVLILFFMIYSAITIKKTKRLLKLQKKESRAFEKQYGRVYDKLYNIFVVKNFAMEDIEKKRFNDALVKKLLPVFSANQKEWNSLSMMQDMIFSVTLVVLLGGALLFLRTGSISAGQFVMFMGYIHMSFNPFRRLGRIYRRFKRSAVAIRRLTRLKNRVPEIMKHGDEILEEVKGNIMIDNIDFSYSKDKRVLNDITLDIKAGESIALVGKSGVGKTTLSELILGYYKPGKGKIYLDGVNISRLDLKWLRDQFALVPQDINLFNDTLLNNLKYAKPGATSEEVKKAAKAAHAEEFIKKLPRGYNTMVGEEGIKLSMGQRQRIAIAMAFLRDPKILIMDEPTSALDAESEKKVKESIEKLIKGRTTIIIAHRFSTIRNVDRIVVFDNGRIAEMGNHRELLKQKGIYHHLYTIQKGLK